MTTSQDLAEIIFYKRTISTDRSLADHDLPPFPLGC
jgi:hypothetical protein